MLVGRGMLGLRVRTEVKEEVVVGKEGEKEGEEADTQRVQSREAQRL